MIRALIGRFVLHCIEREGQRAFEAETRGLDFDALTKGQISDLLHGRPIDVSRAARIDRPLMTTEGWGTQV